MQVTHKTYNSNTKQRLYSPQTSNPRNYLQNPNGKTQLKSETSVAEKQKVILTIVVQWTYLKIREAVVTHRRVSVIQKWK